MSLIWWCKTILTQKEIHNGSILNVSYQKESLSLTFWTTLKMTVCLTQEWRSQCSHPTLKVGSSKETLSATKNQTSADKTLFINTTLFHSHTQICTKEVGLVSPTAIQ